MTNRTFTMIKPDVFKSKQAGNIIQQITDANFKIIALKLTQLTQEKAKQFYAIHKDKPFYNDLVEFMCSGPIIAAVLEKENAVVNYRQFIGNTNPALAEKGTIRNQFGSSTTLNAVHGADSDENALIEADFFFTKEDYI